MRIEVTGKLDYVFPEFRKNNFVSRDFSILVDDDGKYDTKIKLSLKKDNVSLIDKYKQGDHIKVTFYLGGKGSRNNNGDYNVYNNLTCIQIENLNFQGQYSQQPPQSQQPHSNNYGN